VKGVYSDFFLRVLVSDVWSSNETDTGLTFIPQDIVSDYSIRHGGDEWSDVLMKSKQFVTPLSLGFNGHGCLNHSTHLHPFSQASTCCPIRPKSLEHGPLLATRAKHSHLQKATNTFGSAKNDQLKSFYGFWCAQMCLM